MKVNLQKLMNGQEMTFMPSNGSPRLGLNYLHGKEAMGNVVIGFDQPNKWKNGGSACEDETGKRNGNTKLCARGHWRPHEDTLLKELVAKYGPQNWNAIAERLEGRSGKSCRLRWFNQLDPKIKKGAFTEEEEERLFVAHKLYGTKWANIARLFPGRTDNAVKNHWHVLMARRYREQNSVYRRKPSFSQVYDKGLSVLQIVNNPCSESTSSNKNNNVDYQSAGSTCTELSLRFSPVHHHQHLQMNSDAGEKVVVVTMGVCEKNQKIVQDREEMEIKGPVGNYASNPGEALANSAVSASESVAYYSTTYTCGCGGENEKINDKLNFIDFLGLGSTSLHN